MSALNVFPAQVRGVGFTVLKASEQSTVLQRTVNADELRIAQYVNPIWHWVLLFNYIKDNPADLVSPLTYPDYRVLQGFVLQQRGKFGSFLLNDPTDNYVGPALNPDTTPNLQAQLQVVTDGTNYYSPIQRNFGGLFYEDITDLNPQWLGIIPLDPIQIYADGVLQGGPLVGTCGTGGVDYQLYSPALGDPQLVIPGAAFSGMYVKWCAGAPAAPVTAQFNFYFRVRFEEDTQDFEQWLGNAWYGASPESSNGNTWTIGGEEAKNGSGQLKMISVRIPGV